jgi:hypothetical protein
MRRISSPALLPDLPGLLFFLVFPALVFFAGSKALVDGDTFWHIEAGLHVLEKGALLTRDVFSHTAYGTPWTAHEWLAEVVMALVHRFAGLQGVSIFYYFIASLSFWILFRIALRYADEWIALICVLVAFSFSLTHLLARPHIFTWLFGMITLHVLLEGGKKLYVLPIITALWANFHGGFILALALQGILIAGPLIEHLLHRKKLVWRSFWNQEKFPIAILLASILACGINPFGYHLLVFPFKVTKEIFSSGIVEWFPPNMQKEYLFRFYLLGILLLLSLPRTETSWTARLLFLFFLNASLVHQRNISIASMFLTPFLAEILTSLKNNIRRPSLKKVSSRNLRLSAISGPVAAAALFLVLMAANSQAFPAGRKLFQAIIPISEKIHPVEAVAFLNANPLPGNMFNKYGWGGYLIYALDPPQKVFIDGRADMYGEEIFGDYQKIVGIKKEVDDLLEKYAVNYVLFDTDAPLVRYLKTTERWQEIYRDEEASILLRTPDLAP